MTAKYFECECGLLEHVLSVEPISVKIEGDHDGLAISQMIPSWKMTLKERIKSAMRLIFKKDYVYFSETWLDAKEFEALRQHLNSIELKTNS